MAQRAYVEVAGFTHVGHMLVECKMPSNVTPRLLIVADGWMTASETCSDGASSTNCCPLAAVNRIASDLLGFSCSYRNSQLKPSV